MQRDSLLPDFFSALGHPSRIGILEALRDGEICQCVLPERIGLDQSTLSRHIKILHAAGVIRTRRDGVRVLLSVSTPRIFTIVDEIRSTLQTRLNRQLADLEES